MGDDGQPYRAYPTLAAARADPDAAVVLEGDYGGQIYLTCPVGLVACDEHALLDLLEDLDQLGCRIPAARR
jgi:hypothetical protein